MLGAGDESNGCRFRQIWVEPGRDAHIHDWASAFTPYGWFRTSVAPRSRRVDQIRYPRRWEDGRESGAMGVVQGTWTASGRPIDPSLRLLALAYIPGVVQT